MRRLILGIAGALLAGIVAANAQGFPSRPITLIVPFPPGGSTDTAARIMAEKMRPILGQSVIIENVGGAGGSIAVGRVARAAPDGYTIDIGQWDTHVGSIIYNINYDLQKDFEPIGLISVNPQFLVAKKTLQANRLNELVAWMKANPGEAKFVNQNAAAHVTGILMEKPTDTKVTFIPYRGAGPAMTDLISGQVDLLVDPGRGRAAAGARRHHQGDRQPVAAALGVDAGHSDLGRDRRAGPLYVRLVRLLRAQGHAEGRDRQAQRRDVAGAGRSGGQGALHRARSRRGVAREQQTPEGLAAFQKAEIDKWWPIIKAAGIKPE